MAEGGGAGPDAGRDRDVLDPPAEKGEDHRRPSRQQEQGCILVLSRKSVSDTHGSDKDSLHFSPFVQRRVFTTLLRP
nr:uncharacterized protein LOC126530507 isoform X2 [Dermacentor andersoni]